MTQEQFIKRIKSYGHQITPISSYINKRTRIKMRCQVCNHEWECLPEHLLRGSGCPSCSKKKVGEKHRLTHEEFLQNIPDSIEILDKYEKYGQVVRCKCKKCGYEWSNKTELLLKNKYCPNCAKLVRYTNDSFKKFVHDKNPNVQVIGNYEEVGSHGNVECKCLVCGNVWKPNVVSLKKGSGCPICAANFRKNNLSKSTEQFISEAKGLFGNKYNYSKVSYSNNKTKVCIICPEHGEFWQTPSAHLKGQGCPKCSYESIGIKQRRTTEDFINIANHIHNFKYSYDKCVYTTKRQKVVITCPIHGDFEQTAGNHIRGAGCPKCNQSKGELLVSNLLYKYNIPHIYQYTLKHQINNRKVIVDFICKYNNQDYVIEYNGIQHYQPIDYFGGTSAFELQKIRDSGLRDLCQKEGVILIEIPYNLSSEEVIILLKQKLNIINYEKDSS